MAIFRVFSRGAISQGMHVQFSKKDRSGLSESGCDGAVKVRDEVFEYFCACGVWDAPDIVEILQSEGDAVERSPGSPFLPSALLLSPSQEGKR